MKNYFENELTSNVIVFLRLTIGLFIFVYVDGKGDWISLNEVNCVTSSSVVIGKLIFNWFRIGKYWIGFCFNGVGEVLLRSDNELFEREL